MSPTDWNWKHPVELQDYPWDCAAASTAWAMQSAGFDVSEQDVILGLGSARISPTLGLLDASGAGLVEYLGEMGITADNDAEATWDEVMAAAGHQPMVMGGRHWNHWSGVRMGSLITNRPQLDMLALANPSPGWYNVGQTMYRSAFANLGPFSAVWFTAW